jgi:GMP synthase-like glutamine amidotransferase
MKIAILQCDSVMDELAAEFGDYPNMVRSMMLDIAGDLSFQVFDVTREEYPQDLDAFDCYISTGSKAAAYAQEPWIERLIHFVRLLDEQGKKLVGICFGHQIIAMACGGEVSKSEKGWGIGVAANRIVNTPAWMRKPKQQLNIIVSHQDQVSKLPPGAAVIAESDFCPYFIVQWSDHFLSIQGHPEWRRAYSRALIDRRRHLIDPLRVEEGLCSLELQPDSELFARWIFDFAASGGAEPKQASS